MNSLKSSITFVIVLLSLVAVTFQNCGKFSGNGDPYEGLSTGDIVPVEIIKDGNNNSTNQNINANTQNPANIITNDNRLCESAGLIKSVKIEGLNAIIVVHYLGQDITVNTDFSNVVPENIRLNVNTIEGKIHELTINLKDYKTSSSLTVSDLLDGVKTTHPDLICK